MKKQLSALLIAMVLALASCSFGGPRPTVAQAPAAMMQTADVQRDEPIKDLGDGYQMKVRGEDRFVKFPSDRYLTLDPSTGPRFKEAIDTALVKIFGCAAFADCKPDTGVGPDTGVYVEANKKLYELRPLFLASEEEDTIIGIVIIPVPGA